MTQYLEGKSNMASLAKPRFTPQQYLAIERAADYKSEYVSGEIFAMVGTSYKHTIIVANLLRDLGG